MSIEPSGNLFLAPSYHDLSALTLFLSHEVIYPSLCSVYPYIDDNATGKLNILGITPDFTKGISLSSKPGPPHVSAIIIKFGYSFHNSLHNFIKNGFECLSLTLECQNPEVSSGITTLPVNIYSSVYAI